MEKPKAKDGMLAAGKKRLEQFRQKKQGKGSTSRNAKPETDLEQGQQRVHVERTSSKGSKTKGSSRRTLSDSSEDLSVRSDSGRNELSIDLSVVGADDTDSQFNAKLISANVLDHPSAHAWNFKENALEQCRETAQEQPQMGDNELISRIDSLEPSGLDPNCIPPIKDYVKAPVELELLDEGFDSSSVTMASDLSTSMAELVVPNIDANHGWLSYDRSNTELSDERVVTNSFDLDHAEAVQECDQKQELRNAEESTAAESLRINQPVAAIAMLSTEHGDEMASELHVNFEHTQSANFSSENFSELAASSQDFSLQSVSKEEEKETSSPGHELDNDAAGIPPDANTTSDNVVHLEVGTQIENKEQNSFSSCDAETASDCLSESKTKLELDTVMADTGQIAGSGSGLHLSPISETSVAADTMEQNCADIVTGLGFDEGSNMEQPRTGEVLEADSSRDLTAIPSISDVNQVEFCGLKTSADDNYDDGMPIVPSEEMTSTAGKEEVTVLDASEPADETAGLNYVKKTAILGDVVDDSRSIDKDVDSVSPNIEGSACEASLVHTSEEGINVTLDQTGSDGRSGSSGFHELVEEGDTSKATGVDADVTSAVKPGQEALESAHVEGIANLIQESFSGDDSSCSCSAHILEAKQAITEEDQILKTYGSSIDVGFGKEVEEIVTSDAFDYTAHEALIHGSDRPASESGGGFAGSTVPASAKIEERCKAALNPEDMVDSLDSGLTPSEKIEEVHNNEATNEGLDTCTAEVVSKVQMDEVVEAFNPGQDGTKGVTVPVTNVEPSSEPTTSSLEHEEDARHSGSEVINTGLETSMAEVVSQLQVDKVVEEFVPGQNMAEGVTVPIIKMDPSSELNTSFSEHEESARPDFLCHQELCRTEVLSNHQIDDPDFAQPVVAVDSNLSYRIEEVGDALPGSNHTKREVDTIMVAAELRLSSTVDHRADTLLSRNASAEHNLKNVSPPVKDDLPLEMLSRDGHNDEADLKSDSIHQSHLSDPNFTHNIWQTPISEETLCSGDGVKFIERNTEREQESSVSAFELATQPCSKLQPEYESIVSESCNSSEIVSSFGEYALPLVVTPDENFEEETQHLLQKPHSQDLSLDVVADAYQNDAVGSSVENTQERHSLTGQSSGCFDKSDFPFESVQEQASMEQNLNGFIDSTLIEEAGLGNKIYFGSSQHVEDKEFGEHSTPNNTGGPLSSGFEGGQEGENVIKELREALCTKETEMESYALLLNFQAAKNSEERGKAEEILTHIVKRLANLVSRGSSVNEDGDHKQHLKPFDVDNGGLERAESMNFDHILQASNYWMDELQKELEEKRQTETIRRQLEDELLMKDSHVKGLTEKIKELLQNCDELQKDSEQMKDLEIKAMQWEELSTTKDTEIGRLSDRVSELSQNYDLVMDEVAKAMEERGNLEGELKYFQKLYAEQESKTSQMEELLSIKDNDLERLYNKVAELSQNYDVAMSEVAKLAEERLSLVGELNHYQRLSAEQEEEHSKMCKRANALADKVAFLSGSSSMDVDVIHGDVIETLENLVASLQGHYETVCRETKDLLLMANNSEAASQVEVNNLRDQLSSKEVELAHLQENVGSLTNELIKTRDDGEKKVQEAEQKALGVRERLSLAVTKGKGLVQQRDNLKQLLAEKTTECETLTSSFKHELHIKTVALNEAENRAKFNSEAVEHVEALESELSYIRNSANALRESFLQKDAVLQKIEELFEDAHLSEELQIKDIYEKVEWLLEANTQKTSILEGQNHPEMVATREINAFPAAEQGSQMQENDNLNRKCDELLRKYRGMAEQSAMLEQSLLERNLLIQRWEEVLDAVDMPASVRSKEPDDKIKWLGTTVSDANNAFAHFQAEIESLQTTLEAVNNASQKLQEENAALSMELAATKDELKTVALDCNNLSKPTYGRSEDGMPLAQAALQGPEESESKQEVSEQPGFQIEDSEAFVTNIRSLLSEIMQKDEVDNIFSVGLASTALENSVKLLVEKNKVWSTEATEAKGKLAELTLAARLAENDREKELQSLREAFLSKTLELNDLSMQLEEFAMKNSLLEDEVGNQQKTVKAKSEELSSAKDELGKLQLEVSQLEDKLASTRQKLSMAVKKGKSVVEQRDALKQSLDEKTTELSEIRKELEAENLAFSNAKQSLKHHLQQMEMLETELLSSKNYASSLEKSVQESNRALQKFAEAVDKISISGAPRSGDLGEKIQWISQLVLDLQRKAGISEQEARKSKKTTELLSLELEEVQGRLDSFAEELMHAEKNISLLIEEKKLAEASKAEAGLRLEHAMANVNSLLFELSESKENQSNLEQENNSLKDSLAAQMEEIQYKQAKAENQLKDLSDLHSKMYQMRANQSSFLGMVADQIFNSSEELRGTKNTVLRISGELKEQGLMSLPTAPVLVNNSFSKWQPEKTTHEWKQGVTAGSFKFLCDEMETELQDFENFFKNFVTASNHDATVISQLLMEIWDGLGPLSQRTSSAESLVLQKDEHIRVLEEVLKAVTERLRYSIKEMEDIKEEAGEQVSQSGSSSPQRLDGKVLPTSYKNLQALAFSSVERLSSLAKDLACSHQEDDIQKERQNENLRNQLSKARAVIDAMDHQQQLDKLKNSELQKCLEESEIREEKTNQELSSLKDVLSTENQEKQGLVQALNNTEMKMGELLAKVEELEQAKRELEASLAKASSRFYTTATNFNRFQSLSEKLIEEAESLHQLLEDRDAQILLLKEEVALKGSETTSLQNLVNEKTADLSRLYQKIDEIVNRDASSSESSRLERQIGSREELLEALATSIRAGTESLQVQLARKDALLQDVQLRHDDMARQVSVLESSLLENQRLMEERGNTSVIDRMMISAEAEDKGNRGKHVTPSVAVVTHGRSGRKVSAPADHLALDVDTESSRLLADMDDEAKGHVFKPLTSSRIVPRGTRILVDRLDGLWVSGERLLRRRPGARLGIMLYWLVLHVWMVAILL